MASVTWKSTMEGNNYASALDKAVEVALTKTGAILEGAAVLNAPVDTGRLRGSLSWRTKREGSPLDVDNVSTPLQKWTLHVGTNVDYAQHVEYGTKHMGAQPFLRPALQHNKFRIVQEFGKWVEGFLKRGK